MTQNPSETPGPVPGATPTGSTDPSAEPTSPGRANPAGGGSHAAGTEAPHGLPLGR